MSDESQAASRSERPTGRKTGPRHAWFPVVVAIIVAAWWWWRGSWANYQTYSQIAAVLVGIGLISFWFSKWGVWAQRTRSAIVAAVWLAMGLFWLLRTPEYNGDMGIVGWRWRYGATPDARLATAESGRPIDDWQTTPRDFPRFLGTAPWPEVVGVRLATNWKSHPPELVWRQEIGAGWSAFAIVANYAFTQEQRGQQELVTSYRVDDGSPVWSHGDTVRFDPAGFGSLGDLGPRATPTVVGERVFTQGATGIVNCLDARTGKVLWMHDTLEETGAALTTWGKSNSPLVVDDLVVISVGAPLEASSNGASSENGATYNTSLIAYDIETGKPRWTAGHHQASYASPIVTTLAGERQIVSINEHYTTGHRVADGKILWEYPWPGEEDGSATCSQPVPIGADRLFVSKGYGIGASLLEIGRDDRARLRAKAVWDPPVQQVMKTKFNNVVVRDGYAYGLDDVLLECLELETGRVMWKKRRQPAFGHGQLLLVGDAIVVLAEHGELALVAASPKNYRELASIQALDPANITWNTIAFTPPFLLIRNTREAACYRLPLAEAQ